jgi:penicillin-binding protein 1C
VRFPVDSRTGEIASDNTPPRQIEERLFTILPPEYSSWGARHGYGKPPTQARQFDYYAAIKLVHPLPGTNFLIDPELPHKFQSIALRAEVVPFVPEVIWYVDGREYERVAYPYETRWNLKAGLHSFQVRFPNAHIESQVVSIKVEAY